MIECCILPTSWQYDSGAQTSILLFQLLTFFQSGGKEWQSVQCKRSDQKNEENGSHGSKIEQRVIQRDSSPKRSKFLKKQKTRKRNTFFSFQSRFLPRQRKKRSKKPSKKKQRRRSPSSSLFSSSSHSSSSKSEKENQETKRFHIVSNENQFKWDLPSELAS